jgi:hypothetical protein
MGIGVRGGTFGCIIGCFIDAGDSKPAAWCALAIDARRRAKVATARSRSASAERYKATVPGAAGNASRL